MTSTTSTATIPEERDNRMPAGIPFIVGNEFAERFCFYGINSILTVYLTQHLHFTESRAITWQSLFKMGAYIFPLLGAVISDVFWGKFRTIMVFSFAYAAGCFFLALFGQKEVALALSLALVAFGTGGIKPCVSTNVGDQFSKKNEHLIERAFSWFYMAINAGSTISIWLCPELLDGKVEYGYPSISNSHLVWVHAEKTFDSLKYGGLFAFGLPALMMLAATVAFIAGRNRYAVVKPAGKAWLKDITSESGRKLIRNLLVIYIFTGCFWMLWDQSNGGAFTLQAQSSLMDKNLGFGITLLPAQLQVVNGILILLLVPLFSYVIYPLMARFFVVTPLRKIGIGFFVTAASFIVVARVEDQIQNGHRVSLWWQILAYVILSSAEIMVSITGLEFSYKQAPLRIKSFITALFLLSVSLGNAGVAVVSQAMVKDLPTVSIESGDHTFVEVRQAKDLVLGQKIDINKDNNSRDTGILVENEGKTEALLGTFIIAGIDETTNRVELADVVWRKPIKSTGSYHSSGRLSTYYLVGANYFYFFMAVMLVFATIFIFVAMRYKEQTFVREEEA